ncbi:YMGG-like glycine zipper-containing protein [Falsihalocynthiibacter sp. S25ZX9]|uniref:glycine zipper 2TM domain-containing protein n=1 Tax=Falsihalocynthiibacter sp. S25ZX9 TaxID=3240870 RepID=UPI00350E9E4A
MVIRQTGLMTSLVMAVALGFAMSSPAAANKQFENTVGGAAVGAGVGYLVGGKDGATGGAVVGAIAGYNKSTRSKNTYKKKKK